ncbi:hypothetical protein AB674_01190 [Flavobacterium sp. ABG]|nr:hypothetical protein AB674_01190 [Flavobacterium sp. ABG]
MINIRQSAFIFYVFFAQFLTFATDPAFYPNKKRKVRKAITKLCGPCVFPLRSLRLKNNKSYIMLANKTCIKQKRLSFQTVSSKYF